MQYRTFKAISDEIFQMKPIKTEHNEKEKFENESPVFIPCLFNRTGGNEE